MDVGHLKILGNSQTMESEKGSNISHLFVNTTNNLDENKSPLALLPTWTIVRVTVCSIGILANSLVIFVIIHGSLWKSVFMNLLMTLAIYDSLYLIAVVNIQTGNFGQLGIGPSTLHCSLNRFLAHAGSLVSSWLTVLISLERFIAIYYPFKVHIFCTKVKINGTIMAITLLAFLSLIPYLYFSDVRSTDQGPECTIIEKDDLVMISKCINYTLYSLVPFLFIAVFNILIIKRIRTHNAFRLRSQVQQYNQTSGHDNSLIAIMVCICLVFVATTLPVTITVIVNYSLCFFEVEKCTLYSGWIFDVLYLFENINHGVNFFLYCLTGSVFRHALSQIFLCKKKKSSKVCLQQQIATVENAL